MFDPEKHRTPKRPLPAGKVTKRSMKLFPEFYILGPGREAASKTDCGHGYRLTDPCPCCD